MDRPDFFTLKNGEKVKLPFSNSEYDRRGVNTVYSRPFVKQQIEFELQYPIKLNDSLSKILGFDSSTAKNVNDFRTKRLNRKK